MIVVSQLWIDFLLIAVTSITDTLLPCAHIVWKGYNHNFERIDTACSFHLVTHTNQDYSWFELHFSGENTPFDFRYYEIENRKTSAAMTFVIQLIQHCKIDQFTKYKENWEEKKSFTLLQSKMYYLQYFLYENWFCVNIKWNGLVYILKLLLPSIQTIVRLCLSTRRIVVQKMCTTHAMNQQIFSMHCEYATTTEMIFSLIP